MAALIAAPWTALAAPDNDAAATPSIVTLDAVTVSGQTLPDALPPGTTITTRHDLDTRSIGDWDDFARRGDPGVSFNRRNKSLNVRGLDADRIVTRIDGVRIPWLGDGARGVQGGLDSVAFHSLASIQRTNSASAAQSGALTGSVELHTLSPDDLLAPGRNFGALIGSGYDSADQSHDIQAALAGRLNDTTRWLLQAGQKRGHDYRNYDGPGGYGPDRVKPNPQDYRQTNVLFKLDHDLDAQHALQFSGEHVRYRADIDNRRAQGPNTSFRIDDNQTRETTQRDRIQLGYRFDAAHAQPLGLEQGQLDFYWQRMRLASRQNAWRIRDARGDIIPGDPFHYGYPFGRFIRDNSIQESGFGATTQWRGQLNRALASHQWAIGADWYGHRTTQASSGSDNCPPPNPYLPAPFGPRTCDLLHTNQADMPRVDGQTWAIWAQDDIHWADGRYALTPALRFDAYRYQPREGGGYASNPNAALRALHTNSDQRLSPSLMFTYSPSADLTVYARYGYGYKAPNPTQLYLSYGAPGTYLNVGNPSLKPEISRGWELGLEAGDQDLSGRLSVFDNRYRDFLDSSIPVHPGSPDWDPAWDGLYPMGVTTTLNRARVRIYGVEASGQWQMTANWYGRAAIAWARGKDLEQNRPLNSVAPLKVSLALGYKARQWGAETLLSAAARRSRVNDPDQDFQAPGYGIVDASAWWEPVAVKGLRLQAGLYNVFDKKYWEAQNVVTSGRDVAPLDSYTEAGRSVRLSVSYRY